MISMQSELTFQTDDLQNVLNSLGNLPKFVRYYDDFDEQVRSIKNFDTAEKIDVVYSGKINSIDLSKRNASFKYISKHLFIYLINSEIRTSTAYTYVSALRKVDQTLLTSIINSGPLYITKTWPQLFVLSPPSSTFMAIKWILNLFCVHSLLGWSNLYQDFVSNLPIPNADKYASVRTGAAFLSFSDEKKIVDYIDTQAVLSIRNPNGFIQGSLRSTCLLLCAYLYGMRPYQIAQVKMRDVRIWNSPDSIHPRIHITFQMAKQKSQSRIFPMTRKLKEEWAPLVALLFSRAKDNGLTGEERLFEVQSAYDAGKKIKDITAEILGAESYATATVLRHTAAQRLVDAGASIEEVATFLGHSDNTTCLVYFQSSPSQNELVNKALSISTIYKKVVEIAHAKFISLQELKLLKEDQQIGGVPHGIPITGIGGCSSGQPSCPFNPITSCYGCRKFMPLFDIEMHTRVLNDMREVVKFFFEASKGDAHSPTYMQLQRTLSAIQDVIHEIQAKNEE